MKAAMVMGIFFSTILLSCAPRGEPVEKASAPGTQIGESRMTEKSAWEDEWEKTLRDARKEGKVVVFMTGSAEVRSAIVKAFDDKYGITVEAITGAGRELSERLIRERRADLKYGDVYQGGVTTPLVSLKPADVLAPLEPAFILPEFKGSETIKKTWWLGQLPWVDKERKVLAFIAYPIDWVTINTEMVKPEELKSFKDLINPKWKGKIIMFDPSMTGVGGKMFGTVSEYILGIDYWRDFAKQEPLIVRDHRMLVEWVARGKYPVGFTARPGEVAEFRKAGAPLMRLTQPEEGLPLTTGSGGLGLVNNPGHPNAAKIFINWLLSKEGITVWSRANDTPTGRLDIPTDFISPENLRQPGVKYFWAEIEDYLLKEPQLSVMAREIFSIR